MGQERVPERSGRGLVLHSERSVFMPLKEEALSIFLATPSSLGLLLVFLLWIETWAGTSTEIFPSPFTPLPHAVYVTFDLHPRVEDYGQLGRTHPSSPVHAQLGKAGMQNECSEHLPIF